MGGFFMSCTCALCTLHFLLLYAMAMATAFSFYRKKVTLPDRPSGFPISFCKVRPLHTNARQDLFKVTGTIFLPLSGRVLSLSCPAYCAPWPAGKQKIFQSPGRKKRKRRENETEGELDAGPICRTQISRAMEDVMTVILIVVLFVVLKPIVKAILKGMGITDRWRDR